MASASPLTASLGAALHPALRPFTRPGSSSNLSNLSLPRLSLPEDPEHDEDDENDFDIDYEILDLSHEAKGTGVGAGAGVIEDDDDPWQIDQHPKSASSASDPSPSTHEQYPPPSQSSIAGSTPAPPQAPDQPLHDALSSELLRLSSVLRSNAVAFGNALERDRLLLEKSSDQLGANLDFMTRTRGRLGEYSRKARGMGWFTLGSIAIVMVSWVLCFILIRLT